MLAPEPHLKACLRVLYFAVLEARVLGNKGERDGLTREESMQLADLMDAVHNLPGLVLGWETCDENLLRSVLADYDARHGAGLLETYRSTIAESSP